MNQGKDPWTLFEQLYHTVEQLKGAQQLPRKEKKGMLLLNSNFY